MPSGAGNGEGSRGPRRAERVGGRPALAAIAILAAGLTTPAAAAEVGDDDLAARVAKLEVIVLLQAEEIDRLRGEVAEARQAAGLKPTPEHGPASPSDAALAGGDADAHDDASAHDDAAAVDEPAAAADASDASPASTPRDEPLAFLPGTAGYDDGFYIRSRDGKHELAVSAAAQLRYLLNSQNDRLDETINGFEFRRIRLNLEGHAFTPDLGYRFQVDFDEDGGEATILDAFFTYRFDERFAVKAGQFRPPFNREALVSFSRQLGIDRSQLHNAFDIGSPSARSQGVELDFRDGPHHAAIALTDGGGGANTPFDEEDSDVAVTGRYEHLLAGEWSQFGGYSAPPGTPFGLLLGVAGHFEDGDTFRATGDLTLQRDGFALALFGYAAFLNGSDAPPTGSVTQWGAGGAAGYYLTPKLEPYVRYEYGSSGLPGEGDFSLLSLGANWHALPGHIRITGEASYSFNELAPLFAGGDQGFLADPESGQFLGRLQFQIAF